MQIGFKKLDNRASLPAYAHFGDAGMDIRTIENYTLQPQEIHIFKTGFALAIPFGYEGQVRSRSGLSSKHGVAVVNGVGTIDSPYRGEIGVPLINLSKEPFEIKEGDRIAQLVIAKVEQVGLTEETELTDTSRGNGGFGSTGK